MKRAVCPGSFDPITFGHLDIIERASSQFDEVIVAVFVNRNKSGLFTIEERIQMISENVKKFANVRVDSGSGLLVEYCKKNGAQTIVKGLRAVLDRVVRQEHHDRCRAVTATADVHVADGGGLHLGPHDHGGVARDVGQQVRGLAEELVEPAVGSVEELAHAGGVTGVEHSVGGDRIHEEAVALVGGHTAGRGVRLGEIALLLEDGHLVADRGGRDIDRGHPGHVGGPDGLAGGHVLLHDGAQDGCLAFVQHCRTNPTDRSPSCTARAPRCAPPSGPPWGPGSPAAPAGLATKGRARASCPRRRAREPSAARTRPWGRTFPPARSG
jgi:cytidyltransferase-like protein